MNEDENTVYEGSPEEIALAERESIPQIIAQVMKAMSSIDIADNPEKWKLLLDKYGLGEFVLPKDLIMSNLSVAEEYTILQMFNSARTIFSNFGKWNNFRKQALSLTIDATTRMNLTRSRSAFQQRILEGVATGTPTSQQTQEKWGVKPSKGE